MQFSFNRAGLAAICSFLLLSTALATTVPENGNSLDARVAPVFPDEGKIITRDEYVAYLKKYYPKTDNYILYTGYSVDQVKAFQKANPGKGYYYYDDFFDAEKSEHY